MRRPNRRESATKALDLHASGGLPPRVVSPNGLVEIDFSLNDFGDRKAQAIYTQNRLPGGSNLPAGFFSIPVPQGFTQMNPNSFDITTLTGYKLYRLCQTWDTRFGALNQSGEKPRLIQFSLKFFF